MKRFRSDWHRTFVHPISKIFVSAVGELSGRGRRRRSQARDGTLAAVVAERDRLYQEMQDLVQYTDAEIEHLKQTVERLRYERDALQMQVWLFEEQIAAESTTPLAPMVLSEPSSSPLAADLASSNLAEFTPVAPHVGISAGGSADTSTEAIAPETHTAPQQDEYEVAEGEESPLISIPTIDLSGLRLALIGGHPSTRRGVIQELQLNYGLRHVVEIPRMTESNTNRSKVKSKIGRCTLVVLITGYMSHRLTEIVYSLKDAGSLAGDVLQLNCRGKSGVVREILNHVAQAGG